jgi:Transglutaminase-like superfamily
VTNPSDNRQYYASHSALTDPGELAAYFAELPDDIAALCRIVQGVMIHVSWTGKYGLSGDLRLSRETQPIPERLLLIQKLHDAPLLVTRSPSVRTTGACRDFALLLCSILRQRSIPARVRCGFASYLVPERYEDHWICEYWKSSEERWVIADAQLDQMHCDHLDIDFDISDLPSGKFLNAGQAWLMYRSGIEAPASFGHGEFTGAWFLRVNVVRDFLSLHKQEVSAWDTWREVSTEGKLLDDDALNMCDRMAKVTANIDALLPGIAGILTTLKTPPWR